ncbi:hypothetical protein OIU85_026443 [Salix viminalis]|uniref:Uncharacterized protein n=1 Tax=Salix viminalis TaxID=40686 RepID=A0A9Q0TNH8_SALVM|nr:hypothetical protein OIU85_026443 [Salix viminalis]
MYYLPPKWVTHFPLRTLSPAKHQASSLLPPAQYKTKLPILTAKLGLGLCRQSTEELHHYVRPGSVLVCADLDLALKLFEKSGGLDRYDHLERYIENCRAEDGVELFRTML